VRTSAAGVPACTGAGADEVVVLDVVEETAPAGEKDDDERRNIEHATKVRTSPLLDLPFMLGRPAALSILRGVGCHFC